MEATEIQKIVKTMNHLANAIRWTKVSDNPFLTSALESLAELNEMMLKYQEKPIVEETSSPCDV